MIPESDEDARKVVQAVLRDNEQLVWAGKPRITRVLFSADSMIMLGVGIFFVFTAMVELFLLDPTQSLKFQYAPEYQRGWSMFGLILSALVWVAWLMVSIAIARHPIYGITTKRVMVISRKERRIVWEGEGSDITSVSIVSNQNGHGSVCIAGPHDSYPMKLLYLDRVPAIATLVAENFGIPFEQVTSTPDVATEILSGYEKILAYVYSPVGDKRGPMAAVLSIGLWLAYLLVMWLWLSTFGGMRHNWLLYVILIPFFLTITAGLIIQLKRCLKR